MKLVNTKIQLNSALILVGLVFFVPSPRQAHYSIVFTVRPSLACIWSRILRPSASKTAKELHREMEWDFCTPLILLYPLIFLMDQVSESELEIIPSFILYDQTYRVRGILDPSSMNPSQQIFFLCLHLTPIMFLLLVLYLPLPYPIIFP